MLLISFRKYLLVLSGKYYWSQKQTLGNLENMCYPKEEGGINFKCLDTVSKALSAKLWWNFRTSTSSLWSEFMWNKYCKKLHLILARDFWTSHIWKKLFETREEVEHNIWWQVKSGILDSGLITGLEKVLFIFSKERIQLRRRYRLRTSPPHGGINVEESMDIFF